MCDQMKKTARFIRTMHFPANPKLDSILKFMKAYSKNSLRVVHVSFSNLPVQEPPLVAALFDRHPRSLRLFNFSANISNGPAWVHCAALLDMLPYLEHLRLAVDKLGVDNHTLNVLPAAVSLVKTLRSLTMRLPVATINQIHLTSSITKLKIAVGGLKPDVPCVLAWATQASASLLSFALGVSSLFIQVPAWGI